MAGATVYTLPRSKPEIVDGRACCAFELRFTVSRYIPAGFVIRIFRLYTDYTTNAGAITMLLGWTKLWVEDVERV